VGQRAFSLIGVIRCGGGVWKVISDSSALFVASCESREKVLRKRGPHWGGERKRFIFLSDVVAKMVQKLSHHAPRFRDGPLGASGVGLVVEGDLAADLYGGRARQCRSTRRRCACEWVLQLRPHRNFPVGTQLGFLDAPIRGI
jgi:hypothetical protein